MESSGIILAIIIPVILCILLAIGLYRWKSGVIVLFIGTIGLSMATISPYRRYLEVKAEVDAFVGKPFVEGTIRFSKDNLTSDLPINHSFIQQASKRFDLKAPIGIRLTPIEGATLPNTARQWNFSRIRSDGTSTTPSSTVYIELDPHKQANWLYQISGIDYENDNMLRIQETDTNADYSGKLTIFFTGRGIERLREELALLSCFYFLFMAFILGIGGITGSIKKRWKNKIVAGAPEAK